MKRIIVFIGLKVGEIGGAVFVPYWLGCVWMWAIGPPEDVSGFGLWVLKWFVGLTWTAGAVTGCLLLYFGAKMGFPLFIRANWGLAKKLTERDR